MENKSRFRSRAIAPAALLLVVSLALVCLSGCGSVLAVGLEPPAAPTQEVPLVDAEVREAKHVEVDAEDAAVLEVDRADKVEAPVVLPTPVVEETRPSETVSLDETWNRYTNYDLGFSLKVPKTMVSYSGACVWNEANDDRSYRSRPAPVPVRIFEDADSVTIAPEYLYELSGATTETNAQGSLPSVFSECNQVPNSLALLQDPERPWFSAQMWKIVAVEVHSDDELDAFIKSRYGSGCSIKEKEATGQDGVYRVRIQGDGKDLSETQCPVNYATMVKYAPEANKVIAWDLGQAYTFLADESFMTAHDQEMVDSFRFLTETLAEASAETADPYVGWTTYTNDAYGFSFKYPLTFGIPHWELSDDDHVVKLCKDTACLVIGYLGQGEDIILRSGMPAGTLVERGTVDTLGQTLTRSVLVYEGKDKAVLYGAAKEIHAGDVRFLISLDELGRINYEDVELPVELQAEVDAIVASLERVDAAVPYVGRNVYTNDAYGFSFTYPLNHGNAPQHWELSEDDHVVKLCKGTACLVIGYLRQGEDIILRSGMPAGTLVERGTVDTLGQTVTRSVLVYEGKDKAVLYGAKDKIQAGGLRFMIALDEFGQINYEDVELSAELQIEVDTIVASLELTAGQ